jgi:hypothetical protein
MATCEGMDCPGLASIWGQEFPHWSRTALWSNQSLVRWVPDLFSGVKHPELSIGYSPPSSAKVHIAELYLYSPSGPLWPVLG